MSEDGDNWIQKHEKHEGGKTTVYAIDMEEMDGWREWIG